MGLCYLELNAALGTGLGTDWPVAVDHAATMETSWIAALAPDLVATDRLPDDAAATVLGVYGPNPRFTRRRGSWRCPDRGRGGAPRASGPWRCFAASRYDPFADLRTFVERYWPEPLALAGRAGAPGDTAVGILLTNPGAGLAVPVRSRRSASMACPCRRRHRARQPDAGETGVPVRVADLGPERGFYIRRQQTAELRLPVAVEPGTHEVVLRLGARRRDGDGARRAGRVP